MRHFVILPDAEAEMLEAAAFYGKRQKELRGRFLAAVQDAFTRVQVNPIHLSFTGYGRATLFD